MNEKVELLDEKILSSVDKINKMGPGLKMYQVLNTARADYGYETANKMYEKLGGESFNWNLLASDYGKVGEDKTKVEKTPIEKINIEDFRKVVKGTKRRANEERLDKNTKWLYDNFETLSSLTSKQRGLIQYMTHKCQTELSLNYAEAVGFIMWVIDNFDEIQKNIINDELKEVIKVESKPEIVQEIKLDAEVKNEKNISSDKQDVKTLSNTSEELKQVPAEIVKNDLITAKPIITKKKQVKKKKVNPLCACGKNSEIVVNTPNGVENYCYKCCAEKMTKK